MLYVILCGIIKTKTLPNMDYRSILCMCKGKGEIYILIKISSLFFFARTGYPIQKMLLFTKLVDLKTFLIYLVTTT